jgi:hypothetical protein
MKKVIFFLCATLFLTAFVVQPTQAQLFKKLKEKAQQAIEKKPAKEATSNSQPNEVQKEESQTSSPTSKTKTKWQPTPDCEKLLTLNSGETILFDETKVFAKEGKMSYAFITQDKSYKYYLIEDGKRSGPFNQAPINQVAINVEAEAGEDENQNSTNDDEKIEIGNNKKDAVTAQYSKTINNKLYIVFNGKNFGPYDFVAKMRVSPDKKKFWAAIVIGGTSDMMAKMGMGNSFLVNESGVKQKGGDAASFAAKMMVSQNFGAAALSILDNGAQKAITISSTGKKQEGNVMDLYGDKGTNMSVAENGDILSIPSQSPTQLLVNGSEAAAFKVPIANMKRLFILSDYKKSVYYQAGKLYRGDGSEEALKGVTFPKFVTINNQPCIYYYKLHETDNGDKDVYLCKKCL